MEIFYNKQFTKFLNSKLSLSVYKCNAMWCNVMQMVINIIYQNFGTQIIKIYQSQHLDTYCTTAEAASISDWTISRRHQNNGNCALRTISDDGWFFFVFIDVSKMVKRINGLMLNWELLIRYTQLNKRIDK